MKCTSHSRKVKIACFSDGHRVSTQMPLGSLTMLVIYGAALHDNGHLEELTDNDKCENVTQRY